MTPIASLGLAAMLGGFGGGLTQSIGPADSVEVSGNASTGTGLSVAGAGGTTYTARSPAFFNADIGLRLSNLRWLEFAAGAQLELEGRVSVAIVPKFRAHIPMKRDRFRIWATLGAPLFVHPFTLYGVMAGVGSGVSLHKHVGIYAEFTAAGFFAGTDLMDSSGLGKIDFAAGVQVRF